MYPKMPSVEQQRNFLDPARLEAFRKNWEYYKMWSDQVLVNIIYSGYEPEILKFQSLQMPDYNE